MEWRFPELMEVKAETISGKLVIILTCVLELWMTKVESNGERPSVSRGLQYIHVLTCVYPHT